MSDPLRTVFAPELIGAIERLVDERVAAVLCERSSDTRPEWLTLDEAAEHARCSKRAIVRRLDRGLIDQGYVGTRRLVRRASLDAFMRGDDEGR